MINTLRRYVFRKGDIGVLSRVYIS